MEQVDLREEGGLFPLSAGRVIDANSVFTSCETVTTQPAGVT